MDKVKNIGVIHSLTQIVLFGIYSSGGILLLPLALAEITGWIMLALWIGFNFIALPFIIQTIDKTSICISTNEKINLLGNILITGISGGLVASVFNLIYYMFHTYYIGEDFDLINYKYNFLPIFAFTIFVIIIGEAIRQSRKKVSQE